ncbi:phosphonate metabolism protein/1,5-bisphosphokinase (PRPP-forming) PhnN [Chelativorans sp. AA-79]|uniref:phosphonate metabolism protein/1,5-bisphosphokinase (PRPP-forming) PhnN n=1 Tax=Chelativorans sp. AA-79 TaxID=3028735 RepID=UPI0023F78F7F|nr:phosphonate metabolism protein/1,5-bisphosphokinase (PRPP-forming) PhnN [Chelativorans sp. AA-79]WEX09568.1 phosphonate metabolism protein/1,5-bisphosphokinase (PRPP-forming) PhnN [Chelativorans sp. AA-79]
MFSATIERAQDEAPFPIRQGVFVAVVGPSGGGKDSVIGYARERLGRLEGDIVFARRVITRPMEPGSEEHDTLDEAAFEQEKAAGRFALSWHANGLSYGLPVSLDDAMRQGKVVVANGSRAVIPEIRARYAHVLPLVVTAPRAVLAERLSRRGRETREEVLARLARGTASELAVPDALVIDNSGPLEQAGERLLEALRKAAAWSDVCDMV